MNQNSPKASLFSRGTRQLNGQAENSASPALPQRNTFIRNAKVSKSVPKVSPKELALYRNMIPAEPLNVFKGAQPRHQTLEIFKKQKQFDKVYVPEKLTKSKNGVNNQIQKSDSVDRVKYLIDMAKKDDENHFYIKKGLKAKGTMYINELWGQKYEEKTIKAASIHKELAAKEKNSWKPLQQHLDDVVELYEKKHKKNYITFQLGESGEKTPTSSVDGEETRPGSKAHSQFYKFQVETQPPSPANKQSHPLEMARHSSLPHIGRDPTQQEIREISTYRNRLNIKTNFMNESESAYHTPKNSEPGTAEEVISKKGKAFTIGSPRVSEGDPMSFSHQLNNYQSQGSPFLKNRDGKMNSPYSAKTHSRMNSYSDSPVAAHESLRTKVFLNDKVHNLNHLINKCDEELDERSEWMNVMNNMQGLFLTPKYNKRIKYEEAHKQKMIENCQELFRLKMKGKKNNGF